MRINTQIKNPLTIYTKSEKLTKVLLLLLVDWDRSSLLLTKRLHMMSEFIGYS